MTQAHSKEWELQYRRVGQNHLAASAAYTILRQDCVCSTQHPEHTEKYWFIITIWHQFTTSPCCWLRISRLSKGNQHHAKSCAADVTEVGVQMRANPNVCPDQAPQPQKHVARRLVCGSKSHQEMMRRKNRKKTLGHGAKLHCKLRSQWRRSQGQILCWQKASAGELEVCACRWGLSTLQWTKSKTI